MDWDIEPIIDIDVDQEYSDWAADPDRVDEEEFDRLTEENFWAEYDLGDSRSLFGKGINISEPNNAIYYFTQAIDLDPLYADAYASRAIRYRELGDHVSAFSDFDTAIRLKPTDEMTFLMRGRLYDELGNYKKAKEDFEKVLSLAPNEIYTEYGNLLFDTNTYRILGFDKDLVPKYDPRQSVEEIETMLYDEDGDSDAEEENRLIEHELDSDRKDFARSTGDGWFYSDEDEED